jgi:hypothetical protein
MNQTTQELPRPNTEGLSKLRALATSAAVELRPTWWQDMVSCLLQDATTLVEEGRWVEALATAKKAEAKEAQYSTRQDIAERYAKLLRQLHRKAQGMAPRADPPPVQVVLPAPPGPPACRDCGQEGADPCAKCAIRCELKAKGIMLTPVKAIDLFWSALALQRSEPAIRRAALTCVDAGVELRATLREQLDRIEHPKLRRLREVALEVFEGQ